MANSNFIKTEEGELICESREIMQKWRNYFKELLSENQDIGEDEVTLEPPHKEMITEIIKSFKNNKRS